MASAGAFSAASEGSVPKCVQASNKTFFLHWAQLVLAVFVRIRFVCEMEFVYEFSVIVFKNNNERKM